MGAEAVSPGASGGRVRPWGAGSGAPILFGQCELVFWSSDPAAVVGRNDGSRGPLLLPGPRHCSLRHGRAFPGVLQGWASPSRKRDIVTQDRVGTAPLPRHPILNSLLDVSRFAPINFHLLPSFHGAPFLFLHAFLSTGPVSVGSVRRVWGEAIGPEGK